MDNVCNVHIYQIKWKYKLHYPVESCKNMIRHKRYIKSYITWSVDLISGVNLQKEVFWVFTGQQVNSITAMPIKHKAIYIIHRSCYIYVCCMAAVYHVSQSPLPPPPSVHGFLRYVGNCSRFSIPHTFTRCTACTPPYDNTHIPVILPMVTTNT